MAEQLIFIPQLGLGDYILLYNESKGLQVASIFIVSLNSSGFHSSLSLVSEYNYNKIKIGKILWVPSLNILLCMLGTYLTLSDSMDCGLPASSVMGFSRQEYWSRLPWPSPEDLPNPKIELGSPTLQAYSLPFELPGKPHYIINLLL